MKNSRQSVYLWLSPTCVAIYVVELLVARYVVRSIVLHNHPRPYFLTFVFWSGLVWFGLAGLCYYKTTTSGRSAQKQWLVFGLSALVSLPVVALLFVYIVTLPIYGLVNVGLR